jgi:hypothetical protein
VLARKLKSFYLAVKNYQIKSDIHFYCYTIFDEIYLRSTIINAITSGLQVSLSISVIQNEQLNELNYRYPGIKKLFKHHKFFHPNKKRFEVVVTTSTNVNRQKLGFSSNCTLVHVPHSLASLTTIYPEDAFDSFDILFAATRYQFKEYIEICNKRNLNGKVFLIGYGKFDILLEQLKQIKFKKTKNNSVLIAPSWSNSELITNFGYNLIKKLLLTGLTVILRPHPSQISEDGTLFSSKIQDLTSFHTNLLIENPHKIENKAIFSTDLLITDYSGIAFEFFFLKKRPVIFINLPRKILNKEFQLYSSKPVEIYSRKNIGKIAPQNIEKIQKLVESQIKSNDYNSKFWLDKQIIHSQKISVGSRATNILKGLIQKNYG